MSTLHAADYSKNKNILLVDNSLRKIYILDKMLKNDSYISPINNKKYNS